MPILIIPESTWKVLKKRYKKSKLKECKKQLKAEGTKIKIFKGITHKKRRKRK